MQPTPTERDNSALYTQRMNKVLDHIDRHLDQDLELADLAAVAHFSAFHFHRVFAAWMGETLGDYLRRRRLDVAALYLVNEPAMPVLEIALNVGFGSGEALARAFKLRFACTPSQWRLQTPRRWAEQLFAARRLAEQQQSNLDQGLSNPDQPPGPLSGNHGGSLFAQTEFRMKVTIQTLPPVRVAYLRHIGPYGPSISRFWPEQVLPWLIAHGLEKEARYGIGHDDPLITEGSKCRYDACVPVPPDFVAKNPAGIAELPGGRYACAEFFGDGPAASLAWTELLREWLPKSGYQLDSRPFFEYYPADACYEMDTGRFECQLCVPLRGL
ncbi:AraC family transcriptional regulator [Paucibacter oligotrophus]|uniref:AraC family transcriptional regulator n=1 Tax=Roseateles oligotrophus TaxID=1769250 RepID=A0A840L6T5_9BURK|nr:AraC family transcriptional regulator [Roseateles oligotrophus]MBB4843501.1 AraC family transcriptional regulator [Roseateles oligotrophus]